MSRLCSIAGFLCVVATVALTSVSASAPADADTTANHPDRKRSRDTWEYVVNAPFKLAFLPVKVVFKSTKEGIVWVTDNDIPSKVHDFFVSDDGRTGVYPVYAPNRGAGAKLFHRGWISPDSKLTLRARAWFGARGDCSLELKRVRFLDGLLTTGFFAGYALQADEHFYGLGMGNDPEDDETDYTHEGWEAEFRLGVPMGKRFHADGRIGIEHNNIRGADSDEPSTPAVFPGLPGIDDTEVRFARTEVVLEYDTRDYEGIPTRGWLATVGGGYFTEIDGDTYEFSKFRVDVRRYIPLVYRRVIMLRVATELTTAASGKEIPFYHLSELGDYDTIRGFSWGRFRQTDAVLASLEYSWPVSRFADFFLFADAGEVVPDLEEFEMDDVAVGWGGGFRVANPESVILKLLVGVSKDEWRAYFQLN